MAKKVEEQTTGSGKTFCGAEGCKAACFQIRIRPAQDGSGVRGDEQHPVILHRDRHAAHFGDRSAFSGEQGLIGAAHPLDHAAVGRHELPGRQLDHVARQVEQHVAHRAPRGIVGRFAPDHARHLFGADGASLPASPVLRCERVTTDVHGKPVLMSEHVFPARRTEFVVELPTAEPSVLPTGLRLVD